MQEQRSPAKRALARRWRARPTGRHRGPRDGSPGPGSHTNQPARPLPGRAELRITDRCALHSFPRGGPRGRPADPPTRPSRSRSTSVAIWQSPRTAFPPNHRRRPHRLPWPPQRPPRPTGPPTRKGKPPSLRSPHSAAKPTLGNDQEPCRKATGALPPRARLAPPVVVPRRAGRHGPSPLPGPRPLPPLRPVASHRCAMRATGARPPAARAGRRTGRRDQRTSPGGRGGTPPTPARRAKLLQDGRAALRPPERSARPSRGGGLRPRHPRT